jgi:hypothetical protein
MASTGTIAITLKGVSQAIQGYEQLAYVPLQGGGSPAFSTPEDVANRALQHLGQSRLLSLAPPDSSLAAKEIAFQYDKLREAELRRNLWRFATRRAIIRPVSSTSRQWQAPTWDPTVMYGFGSVVFYADLYGRKLLWISTAAGNVNQNPIVTGTAWQQYFGAVVADLYDSTQAYFPGDLVYENPQPGYYNVYLSLTDNNADDPSVVDAWDATVSYLPGAVVQVGSITNYVSLVADNLNFPPATSPLQWAVTTKSNSYKWTLLGGLTAPLQILAPLAVGPATPTTKPARAIFPLPYGYIRKCPQDPKAGSVSLLGAPMGANNYEDWLYEGNYIITEDPFPIAFRFVANVCDVSAMDPMFCEGFACRLAIECCEQITQSTEKISIATKMYGKFMTEARQVNGIETDAVEPPLDDYLNCRQ